LKNSGKRGPFWIAIGSRFPICGVGWQAPPFRIGPRGNQVKRGGGDAKAKKALDLGGGKGRGRCSW